MTEFKDNGKTIGQIIKEHYPLQPKSTPRKRWKIAQTRGTNKLQAMRNSCTEASYYRIIKAIKTLYLKPNEIYFERDYRQEVTENFLTMHCLMTAECYLYLECDFCYDFQVEYAFHNCPYESAISTMFIPFPLDTQAKEKQFDNGFITSFQNVLRVQDKEFIKTFNPILAV